MAKSKSNVDKIVEIFTDATIVQCKNYIGIAQAILRKKMKDEKERDRNMPHGSGFGIDPSRKQK